MSNIFANVGLSIRQLDSPSLPVSVCCNRLFVLKEMVAGDEYVAGM